jgi:hypothetical protein
MVPVETGPVISLDQLQTLFVEAVQRYLAAIHVVEDTEFHLSCPMI